MDVSASQACILTGPAEPYTGGVEGEEAEYAWLPIHCLKPFEPQDATKDENHINEDPNLSACIKAAEKVLADLHHAKQSDTNGHAAEGDADSDSDGGQPPSFPDELVQELCFFVCAQHTYACCALTCSQSAMTRRPYAGCLNCSVTTLALCLGYTLCCSCLFRG